MPKAGGSNSDLRFRQQLGIIHHALANTLNQLPAYQQLQNFPGLNHLPARLTANLAKSLSHIAYNNLINTIEDPVAAEISTRLSSNFRNALKKELQKKHNIQEIQTLLVDLLEEIKINTWKELRKLALKN